MAETTITGLPNAAALTGTERVPMDQAGVTVDATTQQVADFTLAAHTAAADPHAQYLTAAEGDAAYATAAQGALAATAIQPENAALSDAREWSAATISQAEAEAGTATTRRAFTALRVFQAVEAWWQGISTSAGRALVTAANAAAQRTALGLGTAATTNATDYAPAAQGVTNGNSHDHNGGDGAQIAYSSLSGLPSIPAPADANPLGPGTAAIGSSTDYAREDHVHPPSPLVSTSSAGLQAPTGFGTIAYASTVDLDLATLTGQVNTITLTDALTLTTSNLANGRTTGLRLIPGASARDLTFPADWVFVSAKPASLPANKVARLTIEAHGTANSDVIAAIAIQP